MVFFGSLRRVLYGSGMRKDTIVRYLFLRKSHDERGSEKFWFPFVRQKFKCEARYDLRRNSNCTIIFFYVSMEKLVGLEKHLCESISSGSALCSLPSTSSKDCKKPSTSQIQTDSRLSRYSTLNGRSNVLARPLCCLKWMSFPPCPPWMM
jgi:hypothetical protein